MFAGKLTVFQYVFLLSLLAFVVLNSGFVLAATSNEDTVQKSYIAYYARPADPAGLDYWRQRLDENNDDIQGIIDEFGNSQEYVERFSALNNAQLVNNLFRNLFNRSADVAGLSFYVNLLDTGQSTLARIALDILNGSRNDDLVIVSNKLNVAHYFTAAVRHRGLNYDVDEASRILSVVILSNSSVNMAKDEIDVLVNGGIAPDTDFGADVPPVLHGNWYRPTLLSTWQWQLTGDINTSYAAEVYDVDLFDTPLSLIQALQFSGKRVICYFSAGSYESYREDEGEFSPDDLGTVLDGWPDEQWLDIRSRDVHSVMISRLNLAVEKGCDGVEPDNMDGYTNDSGFNLTASDQLAFNKFIANAAHNRNLSVALKNDLEQVAELVAYFDFAVNEQCSEFDECDALAPFIETGKPVFHVEYQDEFVQDPIARSNLCAESITRQFSTLILPLDLDDSFRFSCL